jgi:hypothetical protein
MLHSIGALLAQPRQAADIVLFKTAAAFIKAGPSAA